MRSRAVVANLLRNKSHLQVGDSLSDAESMEHLLYHSYY